MGAGISAERATPTRSVPMAGVRGVVPEGRRTAPESASRVTSAVHPAIALRLPRIAVGESASTRQPTPEIAEAAARAARATGRASAASAKGPALPTARLLAPRRAPTAVAASSPAAATRIATRSRRPADVARAPHLPWGPVRHARATRTVTTLHGATGSASVAMSASATGNCHAGRTPTARRSSSAATELAVGRFA